MTLKVSHAWLEETVKPQGETPAGTQARDTTENLIEEALTVLCEVCPDHEMVVYASSTVKFRLLPDA